jgi:hypothetical protein
MKKKPRAKIDRLAHKYALDISKFHEKSETKIDFNNLNKDFYGDIETNDIMIKSDKKKLNKIKNITLKEFIYSNKIIPDEWKNKFNYQRKMTNIISRDKQLLSYIGSFPNNNYNYDYLPQLPKINTNYENNDMKTSESKTEKSKKTFKFRKRNEFNTDDVKLVLDDYKAVYPIKEKLQNLMDEYTNNTAMHNMEMSKENNLDINENEINSTQKTNTNNSRISNYFSYIKKINPLNKKERTKIQRSFRQNIFTLDSLKHNTNNTNLINHKSIKNKFKIKRPIEIKNKTIEKSVKSINYYGPHFSFCPSCKNKNLQFYNYMEPNQCLELINHIKNYRKSNNINIYLNKNYTNNPSNTLKNQRSTSAPKLTLFDEKESEEQESDENTYKVDF